MVLFFFPFFYILFEFSKLNSHFMNVVILLCSCIKNFDEGRETRENNKSRTKGEIRKEKKKTENKY